MAMGRKGKKRIIAETQDMSLNNEVDESGGSGSDEEVEVKGKGKATSINKSRPLSQNEEQILAEFYADHQEFYDKTMDDYKNIKRKERLLQEKSKEMNISVKDITSWYTSARSSFGRIKRTKSGQAATNMTPRQRWLWQNCQFFREYISHRNDKSMVLGQIKNGCSESQCGGDDGEDDGDNADEDQSTAVPIPTSSSKASKKRRMTADVDSAILDFIKTSQSQSSSLQAKIDESLSPKDEVDAWVLWMSSSLKPLPKHLWRDFCDESYSLVRRYVRQADALQSSQCVKDYQTEHQSSTQQPFVQPSSTQQPFAQSSSSQQAFTYHPQPSYHHQPYQQQPHQFYQQQYHPPRQQLLSVSDISFSELLTPTNVSTPNSMPVVDTRTTPTKTFTVLSNVQLPSTTTPSRNNTAPEEGMTRVESSVDVCS